MKAHIFAPPRAVLLWRFGPESEGYVGLARVAQSMNLHLIPLGDAALDTEVGALCGGGAAAPQAGPAGPDTPAAVISGLGQDNGELNRFVEAIQTAGAVLPIKAAVTPTSMHWTLRHLLAELSAEHAALGDQA